MGTLAPAPLRPCCVQLIDSSSRPTSAILPPAKRQFKQNSEEDRSTDRRHRKTISRVMDAIVGSVKCFLGALFENPKKGQMMSKPALLMRENIQTRGLDSVRLLHF